MKMKVSSILGRRFVVTVDEHPFYSFYADNVDQRAWSNRLRAAVYSYIGSLNLEYSYNDDLETEILENWLNLDYRFGDFSAGLRFDVFQPNDPDPSISRGKEKFAGIDIIYFGVGVGNPLEGLDLTVGNYYTLLGRGMIINSYEDRSIRIDNNLLGLKVTGKYGGFIFLQIF